MARRLAPPQNVPLLYYRNTLDKKATREMLNKKAAACRAPSKGRQATID
jgi:hypothetical protein